MTWRRFSALHRGMLLPALILLVGMMVVAGPHYTANAAPQDDLVLSQGTFVDGEAGEHGSGTASIVRDGDGNFTLRLENFSVSAGPALSLVLSPDAAPSGTSATSIAALQVGQLKSRFGSQSYLLPIGFDPADYRSVFVFCNDYKVVMTFATF